MRILLLFFAILTNISGSAQIYIFQDSDIAKEASLRFKTKLNITLQYLEQGLLEEYLQALDECQSTSEADHGNTSELHAQNMLPLIESLARYGHVKRARTIFEETVPALSNTNRNLASKIVLLEAYLLLLEGDVASAMDTLAIDFTLFPRKLHIVEEHAILWSDIYIQHGDVLTGDAAISNALDDFKREYKSSLRAQARLIINHQKLFSQFSPASGLWTDMEEARYKRYIRNLSKSEASLIVDWFLVVATYYLESDDKPALRELYRKLEKVVKKHYQEGSSGFVRMKALYFIIDEEWQSLARLYDELSDAYLPIKIEIAHKIHKAAKGETRQKWRNEVLNSAASLYNRNSVSYAWQEFLLEYNTRQTTDEAFNVYVSSYQNIVRPQLADVHPRRYLYDFELGKLYWQRGQVANAKKAFDQAISTLRSLYDDQDKEYLRIVAELEKYQ